MENAFTSPASASASIGYHLPHSAMLTRWKLEVLKRRCDSSAALANADGSFSLDAVWASKIKDRCVAPTKLMSFRLNPISAIAGLKPPIKSLNQWRYISTLKGMLIPQFKRQFLECCNCLEEEIRRLKLIRLKERGSPNFTKDLKTAKIN